MLGNILLQCDWNLPVTNKSTRTSLVGSEGFAPPFSTRVGGMFSASSQYRTAEASRNRWTRPVCVQRFPGLDSYTTIKHPRFFPSFVQLSLQTCTPLSSFDMMHVGCPQEHARMTNLETQCFTFSLDLDAPNKPRVGFATLAVMWESRNIN